jgi:hypothetical protein
MGNRFRRREQRFGEWMCLHLQVEKEEGNSILLDFQNELVSVFDIFRQN